MRVRVTITSASPVRRARQRSRPARITPGPARRRRRGPKKTKRQQGRDQDSGARKRHPDRIASLSPSPAVHMTTWPGAPGLIVRPIFFFGCPPKAETCCADSWSHAACGTRTVWRCKICVLPGASTPVRVTALTSSWMDPASGVWT